MQPSVEYWQKYEAHLCPSLEPVKAGRWVYKKVRTHWEHMRVENDKGFVRFNWDSAKKYQLVRVLQCITLNYEAADGIRSLERL